MHCTKCLWGWVSKQLHHPPTSHFVLILSLCIHIWARQDFPPHHPSALLLRGRTTYWKWGLRAKLCSIINKQSYISTHMNSLYIVSLLHMSPGHTLKDIPPVSEMAGTSTIKMVLCIERTTYQVFITSMYEGAHLPTPLVPLSPWLSGQSVLRT